MAFSAKYPGECGNCGERFEVGTLIEYDRDDQLVHAPACPPERPVRRAPRCPICTLEHPGTC